MNEDIQTQSIEETPTDTAALACVDVGRYSLQSDGRIFWQANSTNPLPGVEVGRVAKGETALSPKAIVTGDQSVDAVQAGLDGYIRDILAPLFALKDESGEDALKDAARAIGDVVFDNMGVVHRNEIEKFVPDLTPELRQPIRRKRMKMGPILVFMLDLVKPAAVNLRALLWGVWNGKDLPMETPADGRVSITVDPEAVDRHFYRSIGYPVFGNKAIRIDMLDRVITDVYDSAKDWKFQAQHKYAEWLGCNIEDLYGVLAAMGHRKIDEGKPAVKEEITETVETPVDGEAAPIMAEVKPELAFFWLKKGKISDRPGKPMARISDQDKDRKKLSDKKNDFKSKGKKPKPEPKPQGAKTFTAKPKESELPNNNPFAILQQLKTK